MRVAIFGSRHYPEPSRVQTFVESLPDDTIVTTGGASGVDTWAQKAAEDRGLPVALFKPARSFSLVDTSDRVVVFWDGGSSGSWELAAYALKKAKPLKVILPGGHALMSARWYETE